MKTSIKLISAFFLSTLILSGCSGGGGSTSDSSTTPGTPGTPAALDVGGDGITTGEVADGAGNAVTANFSSALDINDLYQIIGFAEVTAGAPFTAALWTVDVAGDATMAPTALDSLIASGFAAAFTIDENGSPVGQADDGTRLVAVLWPRGATPTVLPPLAATGNYSAYAVSADGTLIAGEARDGTGTPRAVIWAADGNGDFVTPPTVLPVNIFASGSDLSPFSSAGGVARAGTEEILVVGEAEAGDGTLHAALWRSINGGASFAAIDLGADHIAIAVNGARQVVGESDSDLSPVLWAITDQGLASAPVSLETSGSAVAINENGRITGWSGEVDLATIWAETTPNTLYETESRAYGLNNDDLPLVVGRNGSQGFVKRVE